MKVYNIMRQKLSVVFTAILTVFCLSMASQAIASDFSKKTVLEFREIYFNDDNKFQRWGDGPIKIGVIAPPKHLARIESYIDQFRKLSGKEIIIGRKDIKAILVVSPNMYKSFFLIGKKAFSFYDHGYEGMFDLISVIAKRKKYFSMR